MDKQLTAVEWFCEQILLKNPIITQFLPNWNFDQSIIEKAKEMEKQQIIDACWAGGDDGEQYYKQTYGGNK
jgi:hypothetical protein